LGGGPVAVLADPVDCYADVLEYGTSGELARLGMRRALRLLARDEDLVVRLGDAGEPFWVAVAEALRAAQGALAPVAVESEQVEHHARDADARFCRLTPRP
jgi:hypothetical protein